jgi:hypothetical protein
MLAKLQRVLNTYSFYDKVTGYCQSLNFITALFLMVLPEEESFWLLSSVLSDYLPSYYNQVRIALLIVLSSYGLLTKYYQDLLGAKTDCQLFETLILSNFPEIGEQYISLGIPISLRISPWFMCLFISVLPTETSMRVLDWFFAEVCSELFDPAKQY